MFKDGHLCVYVRVRGSLEKKGKGRMNTVERQIRGRERICLLCLREKRHTLEVTLWRSNWGLLNKGTEENGRNLVPYRDINFESRKFLSYSRKLEWPMEWWRTCLILLPVPNPVKFITICRKLRAGGIYTYFVVYIVIIFIIYACVRTDPDSVRATRK